MDEMTSQALLNSSSASSLAPASQPLLASGEPLNSKFHKSTSSPPFHHSSWGGGDFTANATAKPKTADSEEAGEWGPGAFQAPGWLFPKRRRLPGEPWDGVMLRDSACKTLQASPQGGAWEAFG